VGAAAASPAASASARPHEQFLQALRPSAISARSTSKRNKEGNKKDNKRNTRTRRKARNDKGLPVFVSGIGITYCNSEYMTCCNTCWYGVMQFSLHNLQCGSSYAMRALQVSYAMRALQVSYRMRALQVIA